MNFEYLVPPHHGYSRVLRLFFPWKVLLIVLVLSSYFISYTNLLSSTIVCPDLHVLSCLFRCPLPRPIYFLDPPTVYLIRIANRYPNRRFLFQVSQPSGDFNFTCTCMLCLCSTRNGVGTYNKTNNMIII